MKEHTEGRRKAVILSEASRSLIARGAVEGSAVLPGHDVPINTKWGEAPKPVTYLPFKNRA